MKLVTGQFNESYAPIIDGVAVATKNYALWLGNLLGPSWVVAPGVPGYHDREPFGVVRYPSVVIPGRAPYRFGLPQLAPGLLRRLERIPFDIVHAHAPFTAGRLALRLARRLNIPIVGTFHTKYRENFEKIVPLEPLVDWQVRRIVDFYRQLDEVWVPSEPTTEVLRSYGFDKPIEVVPNGTDFELRAHAAKRETEIERQWGIGPNDTVLLYVGQLIWEKNLKLLIEALGLLHTMGKPYRMVFVGEGYARREMERDLDQLGIRHRTTFTGVVRNRDSIGAWYGRADAFLFPSTYDTSALVMREAASFGVPTFLIRGSIPAAEIEDGMTGFLSDNVPLAFASRLATILAQPEVLRRVGEAARHTLYHPWSEVLLDVKDRYLKIVARSI